VKAKAHSAKVPDQNGLRLLMESVRIGLSRLRHLFGRSPPRRKGERGGLRKGMGLSVAVVLKPAKSNSEKVMKVRVQEWAKEKTKRSSAKDSCSEAPRSNWTRPSSVTLASENTPSPTLDK
jgi:hypothetical protein